MQLPDPPLDDGVVRLRPWELGDLECLAEASGDAAIVEITSVPAVYSDDEARAYIERQWSRLSLEESLSLVIATASDNRAIGSIVLLQRPQRGVYGVGYWLVDSARRHGFTARAVALLSDWALTAGGVSRVEAWVEPVNLASQRVLAAAGFEVEGLLRSFLVLPTRRADVHVFSRVAATSE